jgi:2-polyprenyl-3-methyl-5-hydroxy-6-metoxy-1,4-benzoquinol methylase
MEMVLPPSDAEGAQREILETIRTYVRSGSGETSGERDISSRAFSLRESIHQLHLNETLVGQLPPAPPTFRARVGARIVYVMRRALFWYTQQILTFHRSVTHAMETQEKEIEELQGIIARLRDDLNHEIAARQAVVAPLRNRVKELLAELQAERTDMARDQKEQAAAQDALNVHLMNIAQHIAALEGDAGDSARKIQPVQEGLLPPEKSLSMYLEQTRKRVDQMNTARLTQLVRKDTLKTDGIYVAFEDQFRGTRQEIKQRLHVYLPLLTSRGIGTPQMPLLDIGCGRGEWLELLRQTGMQARGVDKNRDMLAICQTHNLDAVEGDAVEHLRCLEAESLGGVTGFHIIEHLPFPSLLDLLDETVRVLKPGGVAIFETPNPANILVSTERFYLDPTHRHPLPSPLVKFLAQERGLCHVEVMPLHPWPDTAHVPAQDSAIAERFNQLFYGPQDYAIVGWKV